MVLKIMCDEVSVKYFDNEICVWDDSADLRFYFRKQDGGISVLFASGVISPEGPAETMVLSVPTASEEAVLDSLQMYFDGRYRFVLRESASLAVGYDRIALRRNAKTSAYTVFDYLFRRLYVYGLGCYPYCDEQKVMLLDTYLE